MDILAAGYVRSTYRFEVLKSEFDRSQRYKRPFIIVYFDLDGFKAVNDQFGHHRGDKLLCAVVNRAKKHLRKMDLMARLGGDEFCLLLPETDQKSARSMVQKIQSALLNEMRRHNWRVTFSIGVLTCREGRTTVSNLIKWADDLMYSVNNLPPRLA